MMQKTNRRRINYAVLITTLMTLCSLAANALAVPIGVKLTFDGKGAGAVVFDGTIHASKGLTCADCHDRQGLIPPMFEMKRNTSFISMRKIEMGMSCGNCHHVSMADPSSCSHCHRKR